MSQAWKIRETTENVLFLWVYVNLPKGTCMFGYFGRDNLEN
jgi:hypothetical protein